MNITMISTNLHKKRELQNLLFDIKLSEIQFNNLK